MADPTEAQAIERSSLLGRLSAEEREVATLDERERALGREEPFD